MVGCSQLTFAEIRALIRDHVKRERGLETEFSKERHGMWVLCATSGLAARIAYEIVDGPVVVRWEEAPPGSDNAVWGLCDPSQLAELPDRPAEPWYDRQPGCSVEALFTSARLTISGTVRWGRRVPLIEPGVYAVALAGDPTRTGPTLPSAPISDRALGSLLTLCRDLKVDGETPSIDHLRSRIASCWLPTETVLYVGKAGTSLEKRVSDYYSTQLGARSPHAGGWFLKTLGILEGLFVHYAASDDPEPDERTMLQAFAESVDPLTCPHHPDPDLLLPFANLVMPAGRRKRHGITGATGCRQASTAERTSASKQPAPGSRRVKLHDEIAAILRANDNRWMTTAEIAKIVQTQGRYIKKDGTSDVTAFQIHGRTRRYADLFERDGSRVRLREQ
jgi:hypothetical protein